jgi:serine/threonine protein phosphatase PrpC
MTSHAAGSRRARWIAKLRRTRQPQADAAVPQNDQKRQQPDRREQHERLLVGPNSALGDDVRTAFPEEFSSYRQVGGKPPSYPAEPSTAREVRNGVDGALIPDAVVDGFAVGALTVRAASITGDSHRYGGEPRQDSVAAVLLGAADRGLVLAVVADGVGSESYSHVGARAACKAAVAALASRAQAVETSLRDGHQDRLYFEVVHVIDEITASIEAEADRLSRPSRELATTLRAVLVPTDPKVRERLAFSVGDGATLRLTNTVWSHVQLKGDDDSRLHDTSTAVLPLHPEELHLDTWTAAVSEIVVICTDGIAEPLRDGQFAELLAEEWSGEQVPGTIRFLWQAQARLRSYDDDRTVVCIWEGDPTSPAESPPAKTSN